MKRNEQNVNSLRIESQYNETAHLVKQASMVNARLLVNSPKASIGITEDGELRVKPNHDASHIDSLPVLTIIESSDDIEPNTSTSDDSPNDDKYLTMFTHTFQGKVQDRVNKMMRRWELESTNVYAVMFVDLKTNPDGTYTLVWGD
jgi:hypothetical protein